MAPMMPRGPTKAFILAAGFGVRMRPLSGLLPKPLMPFWGRPLLEYTLELLASWGVRDALLNLHHRPEALLEFALTHQRCGVRLQFSFEPEILGTGGALRKGAWFLDGNPFWLVNGDIAADLDPWPMIERYWKRRALAVCWLTPERGPRTVLLEGERIVSFRGPPRFDPDPQESPRPTSFTLCGVHVVSPRILRYLPESGPAGLIETFEKAMAHGECILGCVVPGSFWADIGSPEDYLEAHRDALARRRAGQPGARLCPRQALRVMAECRRAGVRIRGFAAVSPGAELQRGATVEDAVVWPGARILARAAVRCAIVGPGARITGAVSHIALPARDALEEPALRFLIRHGAITPRTTVEMFPARGSGRVFYRLHGDRSSAIFVQYDPERVENRRYARHARFLARLGLPVPQVFAHDARQRFLLIEDAGRVTLAEAYRRGSPAARRRWYRRILDHVARLHRSGAVLARRSRLPLMPRFSPELFRWEREYFIREFLERHAGLDSRHVRGVRQDLARVARRLAKAKRVLLHRDLQSSNVLLRRGAPVFVDFQGMRLGPAAYDLASLLCDPYVMLPERAQKTLLAYYLRRVPGSDAGELFWWAAVQRLAQALGAYARLGRLPGARRFLQHIPAALRMLERAIRHVNDLPHLSAWLAAFRAREKGLA